jgi:arylsulfatase
VIFGNTGRGAISGVLRQLFAAWLLFCGPAATILADSPTNIILVVTDDQGKGELSFYGNKVLPTPHLDRLANQSTRFEDFHVSPTCSPTRAALMTGLHPFKVGVTHTIIERERLALDQTILPQYLKPLGYTTGVFGKWHLGDDDPYQPYRRGFDEAFIHGAGGIGQKYDCSNADAPPNRRPDAYFNPVINHNGQFVKTTGYCTDVFFAHALGWIKQQAAADKPFFAYIATNTPHNPLMAPEEANQPFLDAGFDPRTAAKFGMITNIDDNVGRLRQKLDDWGLTDNTLLIFMTDNGAAPIPSPKLNDQPYQHHNAGLKGHKGSVDEGGTRVPCFFYWPGHFDSPHSIDQLARHTDLLPTIVSLAGGTPPPGIDGLDLSPLLRGENIEWPTRTLFIQQGRWPKGADPDDHRRQGFAVRTPQYRLVGEQQLFDIAADPGQRKNIAAEHPEVVAQLLAAHDQFWQSARTGMVNEDEPNAAEPPYWKRYNEQLQTTGILDWSPPTLD